jgi:C4-type Zn-finger protein
MPEEKIIIGEEIRCPHCERTVHFLAKTISCPYCCKDFKCELIRIYVSSPVKTCTSGILKKLGNIED